MVLCPVYVWYHALRTYGTMPRPHMVPCRVYVWYYAVSTCGTMLMQNIVLCPVFTLSGTDLVYGATRGSAAGWGSGGEVQSTFKAAVQCAAEVQGAGRS
eukprot:6935-Rhodomonas_salina.1